jgi:hypothetical protein
MGTDFTFAYGSNMNRSELRSWLEAAGYDSSLIVSARPAVLEGYDFVWNFFSEGSRCGTANLEKRPGGTVWGVLIEFDVTLLKAFDRKEGHPYFYARGETRMDVRRVEDGKLVGAWVYRAKPNRGGRVDVFPSREYKKIVLDAAISWGFPEESVDRIRNWETQ